MEGSTKRGTHDDTGATGHGLAAGPDAGKQAPEGAGRPSKVSPRSQGGGQKGPILGGARHEPSRADDAASPGRPAAKDKHPRLRALFRRYRWRVQEG